MSKEKTAKQPEQETRTPSSQVAEKTIEQLRKLSGLPDPTHREYGDRAGERLDPERRKSDLAYIRAWHKRKIAKRSISDSEVKRSAESGLLESLHDPH